MLNQVLGYINNYFEAGYYSGKVNIKGNIIAINSHKVKKGQYVQLLDTFLNDGVYKVIATTETTIAIENTLNDETIDFAYIIALKVPKDLIDLSKRIGETSKKLDKRKGILSESTLSYRSISFDSTIKDWQSAYATELANYIQLPQPKYIFTQKVEKWD